MAAYELAVFCLVSICHKRPWARTERDRAREGQKETESVRERQTPARLAGKLTPNPLLFLR